MSSDMPEESPIDAVNAQAESIVHDVTDMWHSAHSSFGQNVHKFVIVHLEHMAALVKDHARRTAAAELARKAAESQVRTLEEQLDVTETRAAAIQVENEQLLRRAEKAEEDKANFARDLEVAELEIAQAEVGREVVRTQLVQARADRDVVSALYAQAQARIMKLESART